MRAVTASGRNFLLFVFFFIFGAGAIDAEGFLVPREVYVGDTAELSFESSAFASSLESGTLYSVPPGDIDESSDVSVKSVLVAQNGSTASVTVRFVPWVAGMLRLPSFHVGKITVAPPSVMIPSLLEKTGKTSLEPARSPLLVPGTTWMLYGTILAAIALIAGGVIAVAKLAAWFLRTPGKRLAGRRVALFLRELRALEKKKEKIPGELWLAGFSLTLRRYLGAFCAHDLDAFLSLTGSEISLVFASSDAGDSSPNVAVLLSSIDRIRFGGAVFSPSLADELLSGSRALSAEIETAAAAKNQEATRARI
jgi:hypothetical protein